MKRLAALLVCAAGAVAVGCAPDVALKPYLTRFDRPLHICHQGGEGLFPSNTLYAYENCVQR